MNNNMSERGDYKSIAVIGTGVTGRSAVRYLYSRGYCVSWFDTRNNLPDSDDLRRQYPDINFYFGPLNTNQLINNKHIICSPGIVLSSELQKDLHKYNIVLESDISFFCRSIDAPVIGITGTNGKTTVSTWTARLLESAGLKVGLGGNIGIPVFDLLSNNKYDIYVLEISSFQLAMSESLNLKVACILNIKPDHMNWHNDFIDYASSKWRIFDKAEKKLLVDKNLKDIEKTLNIPNSIDYLSDISNWTYDVSTLYFNNQAITRFCDLGLSLEHEYINACTALSLCDLCGLEEVSSTNLSKTLIKDFSVFKPLKHRCQQLDSWHGIDFVNDSKATNIAATEAALFSLKKRYLNKIILLIGGRTKGEDYSLLIPSLNKTVKNIVVFGESRNIITKFWPESVLNNSGSSSSSFPPIVKALNLKEAMSKSLDLAESGDCILLSPSASSFDEFSGFEARGDSFINFVEELKYKAPCL